MEESTVLGYVKKLIETCPHLVLFKNSFAKVDIEELGEEATCYSIEPVPCNPVLKRYLGGSSKRQFQFIFASKEMSIGNEKKLENNEFFEKFSRWMDHVSRTNSFTDMENNREALEIRALTGGYIYNEEETKSQYQIQCLLKYYEKEN